MIVQDVIEVRCDGCGYIRDFGVMHLLSSSAITIPPSEVQESKWTIDSSKNTERHYCPRCKDKPR